MHSELIRQEELEGDVEQRFESARLGVQSWINAGYLEN